MTEDALAFDAGFSSTDGERYLRVEHPKHIPRLAQRRDDGLGIVRPVIHHRQKYAINLESWVDLPLHLCDGAHQQGQALC